MHFIDLYKIFKDAKVGIPGAFGYGLKTVAKALHKLGMIADTWEENLNGADAMVAAWYLNGASLNKDLRKNSRKILTEDTVPNELGKGQNAGSNSDNVELEEQPTSLEELAKEIILYNYYDCKVMEEIVEFLRRS
jgi:hypothetical protein